MTARPPAAAGVALSLGLWALGLSAALQCRPALGSSGGAVCADVAAVPDSTQVAWLAPLGKRVGASAWLEVVRVSELRAAAKDHSDPVRLLQVAGILGRHPTAAQQDRDWQVVIFDVDADWLCRPIDDPSGDDPSGDDASVGEASVDGPDSEAVGVALCSEDLSTAARGHRKGWTGCGYSLDTASSTRGLDVFRVDWQTASGRGFCLMPLSRFIEGA